MRHREGQRRAQGGQREQPEQPEQPKQPEQCLLEGYIPLGDVGRRDGGDIRGLVLRF